MNEKTLIYRLSEGVGRAARSANFCVSGTLPVADPGIDVDGIGRVKLPLKPAAAKKLAAACSPAPYGKGTRTLVNKKVRNSFELQPSQFIVTNPDWDDSIAAAIKSAADQLGLPADRVQSKLYKLLLYRPGGFFLPHRDSEKTNRMVGSLIVVLPTPFEGGELTVRHQGSAQRLDFKEAAAGQAACFAAFYADCEHEVSHVMHGFRLCLAYNLTLKRAGRRKKTSTPAEGEGSSANELAESISKWIASAESTPLVFALDHHYTQRGLSLDLLKGEDRTTAQLVLDAAEEADCLVYMCQISRHLSQFADDGRWGRRRYYDAVPSNLELGEVFEDDLQGSEWVDPSGRRQPLPEMRFSPESIVASTPLDQWRPTREEYEGYTGNAGNTLDRWYHRSALCVWHCDHHYDIIARADVEFAIQMLAPLVKKLKNALKNRQEEARIECVPLARAIIGRWPKYLRWGYHLERKGPKDAFPALLVEIGDVSTARDFLEGPARNDRGIDIAKLVVSFCRKHGCEMFADELTQLFASHQDGLSARDAKWLDQLACAKFDDPAKEGLVGKLASLAAEQFCQPLPSERRYRHQDSKDIERTLAALVRILIIAGNDDDLERVIAFLASHAERFSLEQVQVPSLERVVAWLRKETRPVPPLVAGWLRSLQQQLRAATAEEPQPPSDWSRPAQIPCTCRYCKELKAFLADPNSANGRIAAPEQTRYHVLGEIDRYRCDVAHKLDKTGRPYSLVFTKTKGSYEQRLKRYAADQKLLERVNAIHKSKEH